MIRKEPSETMYTSQRSVKEIGSQTFQTFFQTNCEILKHFSRQTVKFSSHF